MDTPHCTHSKPIISRAEPEPLQPEGTQASQFPLSLACVAKTGAPVTAKPNGRRIARIGNRMPGLLPASGTIYLAASNSAIVAMTPCSALNGRIITFTEVILPASFQWIMSMPSTERPSTSAAKCRTAESGPIHFST